MTEGPSVRTRESIEQEKELAREAVEIAEDELRCAEDELERIEAELAALPPEGVDEELWYARRDPRQMRLVLA